MRGVLAALLFYAVSAASAAFADETVRIAVGRFPKTVTIAASDLRAVTSDGLELVPAGGKLVLEATAQGMRAGKDAVRSDILKVHSAGLLELNGHRYREHLEVRFRLYDKKPELLVVHPLDLETYVAGIVSSELPREWPLETYKAQAVASRTFAVWQKYRRLDLPYHMESTVLDQVYGGAQREHPLAVEAARATRGLVITSNRGLAQAYFHASCGDRTESALDGWGSALTYLPGSVCNACSASQRYRWSVKIPRARVETALKPVLGEAVRSVTITSKTETGRARSVTVRGAKKHQQITGADLRRLLGYNTLWSTWIEDLALGRSELVVTGRGSGHGVGMCQWGARGLALEGQTAEQILARYYPGTRLQRLY